MTCYGSSTPANGLPHPDLPIKNNIYVGMYVKAVWLIHGFYTSRLSGLETALMSQTALTSGIKTATGCCTWKFKTITFLTSLTSSTHQHRIACKDDSFVRSKSGVNFANAKKLKDRIMTGDSSRSFEFRFARMDLQRRFLQFWFSFSRVVFQVLYLINWMFRSLFPSAQRKVTRFNPLRVSGIRWRWKHNGTM